MKIFKKALLAPWIAASLLVPASVNAEDNELQISGFASVVASKFSEDNYQYADYSDDFSFSPDSIIGIQFSKQVSDDVSVTTQFTAKGADDYDVEAALAYITYSVNRDWDIRVGKIRTPFFYYSDFLDVGYAYPWIRPPEEVYRVLLFSFDGIDTIYRMNHGEWSSTWQVYHGNEKDTFFSPILNETVETIAEDFLGFNVTLNNDWLTLRGGYVTFDLSQQLFTPLRNFFGVLDNSGFSDLVDTFDLSSNPKKADYTQLAALVDYNDWLLNLEYTALGWDRPHFLLNDTAWSIMAGRRIGDFTLHFTYARKKDDPVFEANTIPEGVSAQLDTYHAIFDGLFFNAKDTSLTAGVRYDFQPGVAFKAEVTRIEKGIAEPLFPGQDNGLDDGTLLSFGVDLVF